jgi:Tol biopolymer transport system component/tRNA A-37 threonylcarbamoyl transferase component Bud32
MTLNPGTKLGPYEIQSQLGAGGMGEVYKATDTRLDRTVAIKVLPSGLSRDPELKQRFEREARAVSNLNHPHICTLHDIGDQDGTDYMVMEYLEGETLADRLKKGALPTEQVLRYGTEIADALDKAHRQGVVHRDLKPGNIMLTKSGAKLLDFGLAKLRKPQQEAGGLSALATQDQGLTGAGTILGTFQYMAPEQLEGKEVDARTDIFAFGVVLYEMVTGKKAFEGESQASLISAIMTSEPKPISELKPMTPPALEHVVKRCLVKDPEGRWQNALDVALELKWISEASVRAGMATGLPQSRKRYATLGWATVSVALLALGLALGYFMRPAREAGMQKFSILAPENIGLYHSFATSPDGEKFVISAEKGGHLWLRFIDSLEAKPIIGTEGAYLPFWSPDSEHIGFFANRQLKRVDLTGSPPRILCDMPEMGRGGTWNQEGLIIFGIATHDAVLHKVSADGGPTSPVTKLDASRKENSHRFPSFLPDGQHFLFTARSASGQHSINVGSLTSGESNHLIDAYSSAAYAAPGYILFVRGNTLLAQPFDISRYEVSGKATVLADNVPSYNGRGFFSASESGILSYSSFSLEQDLAWIDRSGKRLDTVIGASNFQNMTLSSDNSRLLGYCVDSSLETSDVWMLDLSQEIPVRLTSDPAWDNDPVWTSDGKQAVFRSVRHGSNGLYLNASLEPDSEELLIQSRGLSPTDCSPDGVSILYEYLADNSSWDLWVLPLSGNREPKPYIQTPDNEVMGRFSPDGKWVAYLSDQSGQYEVYLAGFPEGSPRIPISNHGGHSPRWRGDGGEIYYVDNDGILTAVEIKTGMIPEVVDRESLFSVDLFPISDAVPGFVADYDVSHDGHRFLTKMALSQPDSFTVVLDWATALAR